MNRSNRRFYDDDEEIHPLEEHASQNNENVPLWNIFRNTPRAPDSGSDYEPKSLDFTIKAVKICVYIVVFLVVLSSAVLSKATLLLMTSQVKENVTREFCNIHDHDRQFEVTLPVEERVLWVWMLIFTFFLPQVATFLRSLRVCWFKSWSKKNIWQHFLPLFLTESLPAIGSSILVFCILPELDVLKAAMLTNAFCFIPGIIGFISRNEKNPENFDLTTARLLDIISIIAQATAFFMWPLIEGNSKLYLIPFSAILISFGWWENYVDEHSKFTLIKKLAEERRYFQNKTYFLYIFISVTNCAIFLATTVVIFWLQEGDFLFLFNNFDAAFSDKILNVNEIKFIEGGKLQTDEDFALTHSTTVEAEIWTALTILLVNFFSSYICYAFVKFASKVSIQEFSFGFAINLSVPVLLSALTAMSGTYLEDVCTYSDIFPGYLFFSPPPLYLLKNFLSQQYAWVWILWLLSQVWITIHIWNPRCANLARTEHLFIRPFFDPFLIDQSVCMNRRRDDGPLVSNTDVQESSDPKVYVCATMWHETGEEMTTFLKSLMRLDEDHCAHRISRYYLHTKVPSYYELECHIFFDDAFIRKSAEDQDPLLNSYVLELIPRMEQAASQVHGINIKLTPPKIHSTPYGGRLEWTLPGRTRLIVHLKDKAKIRAKKRWSQVMYMYYLLGYKLMDNPKIERKTATSENTFILALDGDIDFKPEALHLLIEYMKKNKKLGAACGRIHPVGSGGMAWYQVFEYAVGHWMQKATEHVIGCVLCSPGCFSLFRGEVLMQDGVMCKYTTVATEAKNRVQYDQGEDRWLCTLILQAGYRVEYSAASDSYTHCPEKFKEFYNQRRRWIPSTVANIIDVISDYDHIVEVNDDISKIYILYQTVLLVGTTIGPGTIFLMLVGAVNSVFSVDQWTSFILNLIPILIFVLVCALCKDDVQVLAAGVLSTMYGLIMMAVLVGVILQIHDDGILAPSSIFFIFMISVFVMAAIIHPKEFYCLKYSIIYYVTVPSMYLLLMIYSIFNMNNVSWGTRDVTVEPSEDKKPEENSAADKNKQKKDQGFFSFLGNTPKNKEDGSLEFSCAGLFKCLFCTHPSNEHEKLLGIQEAINNLNKKLDAMSSENSIVEEPKIIENDDSKKPPVEQPKKPNNNKEPTKEVVMDNSWFYHKELMNGKVEWLEDKEEKFWNTFIKRYLEPIDEEGKKEVIQTELKDLRDTMVFTFFMVNALFVLVVFLLTLKKDIIHIDWPFTPKLNFTYIENENEIKIMKSYLQLEPISSVFLLSFGGLLITQTIGMLLHRFETFSQILSNTVIEWNIFEPKDEKSVKALKYITKDNAVRIAKKLQQLHDVNKTKDEIENENLPPGKRKSVFLTNVSKSTKNNQIYDLVQSYQARMKMYDDEDFEGPVDRKTVTHIKATHSEVIRKSQANLFRIANPEIEETNTPKLYENPDEIGETFS